MGLHDRIEALRDRLFGAWQMLAAICESDAQTDPLGASADRIKARDRAAEGYRMANSILAAEPSDAGLRNHQLVELQQAFDAMRNLTFQGHSSHWDPTMSHGAGCPECKRVQDERSAVDARWDAALRSGGDGWVSVKERLPEVGQRGTPEEWNNRAAHKEQSSPLSCPFCGEGDYDKVGLRDHLMRLGCDAFENTPTVEQERKAALTAQESAKEKP